MDYFGARYFSGAMGRFTSADKVGGKLSNPQSLNRYSYVLNNPLKYNDPTGLYECYDESKGNKCEKFEEELVLQRKSKAKDGDVARAANAYGKKGKKNGVYVTFADIGAGADTTSVIGHDDAGKIRAESYVVIDSNAKDAELDGLIGQEGSHVADAQEVVNSGLVEINKQLFANKNITPYASELRGFGVTDAILKEQIAKGSFMCEGGTCELGLGAVPAKVPGIIKRILSGNPKYNTNGKPMSEQNQGLSVVNGVVGQVPETNVPH